MTLKDARTLQAEIKRGPRQPTADECYAKSEWTDETHGACMAFWFPQLGGYCAKAVATHEGECLNVWVWHDGDFPFADDQEPRELHVCDPDQFVQMGTLLASFQDRQP